MIYPNMDILKQILSHFWKHGFEDFVTFGAIAIYFGLKSFKILKSVKPNFI